MSKKILGLDLGTNSIGWALVETDFENKTGKIIGAGSRIIPMDQGILGDFDRGNLVSQTAERTGYRGIRRLRERHLLRRERLHRVLHLMGFLPKHYAKQIDFKKNIGKFIDDKEPKLAWVIDKEIQVQKFIFGQSFDEMLHDFAQHQPQLLENGKKIPYDWTIYYLRKKALTQKIAKEELAWILLNFNQKRGYYQLRDEEEEKTDTKEYVQSFNITSVEKGEVDKKNVKRTWYKMALENGWEYSATFFTEPLWLNTEKEFLITEELDENGNIKIVKEKKTDITGKEKRRITLLPSFDEINLMNKKEQDRIFKKIKVRTEVTISNSGKTVGQYIYDTLLKNPSQKIKGKLVRVIERKFYKEELIKILQKQKEFHDELNDKELLTACVGELYSNNKPHRNNLEKRDFTSLFVDDIIFYQRPLKSKKSLISDCRYEAKEYTDAEGCGVTVPVKCIARSHPLFQEFRLWQWLQNLKIYRRASQADVDVTSEYLQTEDDWTNLYDWLSVRKEINQKALLGKFKLKEENFRWNYVEDKSYPCNETRAQIVSRLSKVEHVPEGFLTRDTEEALWHILYSVEDKVEIEKALATFARKYGLSADFTEKFAKFPPFDKEYGSYSAKAIKKLLPLMRAGKYWDEHQIDPHTKERIQKIIDGECDENIRDRVREKAIKLTAITDLKGLPLWLACYVVYDRHAEEGEIIKWKTSKYIDYFLKHIFQQHSLRNPIVEQVITETMRVVSDIWMHYGRGEENFFDEIHVELGREMKNPAEKRKKISEINIGNENTNLRIKALLVELLNCPDVENVRPYSPSQQEIMKIYEEGALTGSDNIDDEILKISKMAQPTQAQLQRYKLWLEQRYLSPYTGAVIPLGKLFTPAYEIEHIIPQARYFDDSLSNKVICESEVNKDKGSSTAYEYIKNNKGKKIELSGNKVVTLFDDRGYEEFVKKHYAGNRTKMKKMLMDDIPDGFIERQLNDSRYISKMVKNLLSNVVREDGEDAVTSKNVIASNGSITSTLKQDWGLNHIWNELITPRFERLNEMTGSRNFGQWENKDGKRIFQTQVPLELQRGFNRKRIDHRHHLLDAIIIACASRNHINFLNNEYAVSDKKDIRFDLRNKLRRIENVQIEKTLNGQKEVKTIQVAKEFLKPWDSFTQDAREALQTIVVSFKQNLRVINKTNNKSLRWEKDKDGALKKVSVRQTQGDNWAIRKPLHKETVYGQVALKLEKTVQLSAALENWEMIADKPLKRKVQELVGAGYDKKQLVKYFKERNNRWDEQDISKVRIYYFDDENVASRVKLDESFTSQKIASITDTGIQKILLRHLHCYDTVKNGKQEECPDLAFSPDGLDELNKNLTELNDDKPHQPIYKVRTYEPKGNKFNVGIKGNKKTKYVEAAKGTNLFFAVYTDEEGKRSYETVPLNIVIERQKQGLSSVPETNPKGYRLLFTLSPNDLVYIPTGEEHENSTSVNFERLDKELVKRIYKVVSFTGTACFFVRHDISSAIVNKYEFSALNKMEKSIEGQMIKESCWKLAVNRIGKIVKVIKY